MHTCWYMFVRVTRPESSAMWLKQTLQNILGWDAPLTLHFSVSRSCQFALLCYKYLGIYFLLLIQERLKKEQEENEHKKKEYADVHLYTFIKVSNRLNYREYIWDCWNLLVADFILSVPLCTQVARDEDLVEQIGRGIYFDLVDHNKVKVFRVPKKMPFSIFKVPLVQKLFLDLYDIPSLIFFSCHILISSPVNFLLFYLCGLCL